MTTKPNAVDMLFELDATLNAIDKAVTLLARVTGLDEHVVHMSEAKQHLRWTVRRLSEHAWKVACQIQRT
jgi:hypothetical protein